MNEFIVMDRSGDTRITLEGDAEVATAMARFDELMKQGYIASEIKEKGGERRLTRTFDPTAYQTLLQPQYIGG